MIRTGITEKAILPSDVLGEVGADTDGAVLLFLGVVRDHHGGRRVQGLTYEAYKEMAETILQAIAWEAKDRFGTDRLAVYHRIGSLVVGDVATGIAVSTPHREEAYQASRYIIEEVKKRLPVWKQEEYLDGERAWVAGHVPAVGGGSGEPQTAWSGEEE